MRTDLQLQIIHLYLLFLQLLFIQSDLQTADLMYHSLELAVNLLQLHQVVFRDVEGIVIVIVFCQVIRKFPHRLQQIFFQI